MLYVALPVLSMLTFLILPILVYWKKNWQLKLFYSRTNNRDEATHILIEGLLGNTEIQKMSKEGFVFRFIKYEFLQNYFTPVVFDVV